MSDGRSAAVPAEFAGLARRFRERVAAEDAAVRAAAEAICAPLRRRLARKPTLRQAMVTDAARRWHQEVPSEFRLDLEITPGKDGIAVREARLTALEASSVRWPDHREPGIGIVRVELTAGNGRLDSDTRPLATVSLHALARRFERGGTETEVILKDLRDIIRVGVTAGDDVRCHTGLWVGHVIACGDAYRQRTVRLRDVRSFISAEMIPDGRRWVPRERRAAVAAVASGG